VDELKRVALDSLWHHSAVQICLSHCVVRNWRPEDELTLPRHANNRKIWRNLRDGFPSPYTREDARRWLAMAMSRTPETLFCIATETDAIGGIGFMLREDVERFSAEIGYWLSEEYWGRGITTEALRAMTDHAMETHRLNRVYALPFAWNGASFRVLEKAGYELEGRLRCAAFKDGEVVDQLMYAFTRPGCGEPGEK